MRPRTSSRERNLSLLGRAIQEIVTLFASGNDENVTPLVTPRSRRPSLLFQSSALTLVLCAASAHAQTAPPNPLRGAQPFGEYSLGDIDKVDPATGAILLNIPLADYKQRGEKLKVAFSIIYSGNQWMRDNCGGTGCTWNLAPMPSALSTDEYYGVVIAYNNDLTWNNYVETLGDCTESCVQNTYYYLQNPDGATSLLESTSSSNLNSLVTADTTGVRLDVSYGTSTWNETIIEPDGVRIVRQGSSTPVWAVTQVFAEDANGNKITVNTTAKNLTDTMNRTIPYFRRTSATNADLVGCPTGATRADAYDLPGVDGTTAHFKVCESPFKISTAFNFPGMSEYNHTVTMISRIILPNSASWTFAYDSYADLSQVITPQGGSVTYTWQTQPAKSQCGYGYRTVVRKDVNDGVTSQAWRYEYGDDFCGMQYDTTVTDPQGNQTVYTVASVGRYAESPRVKQVNTYLGSSSTGLLLQSQQTQWQYDGEGFFGAMGTLPTSITTNQNGYVRKTTYSYDSGGTVYDPSNLNHAFPLTYRAPTRVDDTDYGDGAPGSILRSVVNSYLWHDKPTYAANNLISLIRTTKILDHSGATVAETDYDYDQSGSLKSSGITMQHDSAPPTGAARGNVTSIGRWLGGAAAAGTSNCPVSINNANVISTFSYYDTGMPYRITDPCLHVVTYDYAPQYYGAFPTSLTNQLNQITMFNYDFNSGLVTKITDANNDSTSIAYDTMWREARIGYPGGGDTATTYDDTLPASVTRTTKISEELSKTYKTIIDGFGRPKQTQATDPEGDIYTTTTYDGLGRMRTQSNPFRTTSDSTYGVTSYTYDPLNRTTAIKRANSDSVSISYSGGCSTVTDESSRSRKVCTDGLGRLTRVLEDPSALNYETVYSYDALGNLLSAVQNGAGGSAARARSFTYDSLSRLICAANPENSSDACPSGASSTIPSGVQAYAYDANGNVLTKTDARGVTTTYSYDALNRLLSKSYSDSATPSSCYQYDSSSVTNGIGRLSASWTQVASAGNCATTAPASGFITKRTVTAYDAMGRLLSEQQYTPAGVATGITYAPSYTYDLAGNLWTSKDGVTALPTDASTLLTFTRTYDAAARLGTVTSNWVNSKHPGSIFAAQSATSAPCSTAAGATAAYAPFGGLQNAALGGGVLTLNRSYDSRLRLSCESDIGGINSPATAGSATVTITGAEQTK